jgi:pimeloyl-ACP methyl ester carboxylesterase
MEEDPIQFKAGDPNLERFVGNNPTNATDPSGLVTILIHGIEDDGKGWAPGIARALLAAWPKDKQQAVYLFTWTQDGKKPGQFEYRSRVADLPEYQVAEAERLKTFLVGARALFKKYKIKESINIIAHSQGTLITLKALELGAEVDNVVFLASPLDYKGKSGYADIERVMPRISGKLHIFWAANDPAVIKANTEEDEKVRPAHAIWGLPEDLPIGQYELDFSRSFNPHMEFVRDAKTIKSYPDLVGTEAVADYDKGDFGKEWAALVKECNLQDPK